MSITQRTGSEDEGLLYLWKCHADTAIKSSSIFHRRPIAKVSIGEDHTAFLTRDHQLYAQGDNTYGQIGIGSSKGKILDLVAVSSFAKALVIDVSCGSKHTAALGDDGMVYCWGDSTHGQCALGKPDQTNIPFHVEIVEETDLCEHGLMTDSMQHVKVFFSQISCGKYHTLALSADGQIWTWGTGSQLGIPGVSSTHVPLKVEYFVGRTVLSVSAGGEHSLAIVRKMTPHQKEKLKCKKKQDITVCSKCKSDIYTFIEDNDTCIISDEHKCPLGCEIDSDSKSRDATPPEEGATVSNLKSDKMNVDEDAFMENGLLGSLRTPQTRTRTASAPAGPVAGLPKSSSTFLNEEDAKEFLSKQLSGDFSNYVSESQKNSLLIDKIETLWSSVTTPGGLTKMVTNIRTTIGMSDRFGFNTSQEERPNDVISEESLLLDASSSNASQEGTPIHKVTSSELAMFSLSLQESPDYSKEYPDFENKGEDDVSLSSPLSPEEPFGNLKKLREISISCDSFPSTEGEKSEELFEQSIDSNVPSELSNITEEVPLGDNSKNESRREYSLAENDSASASLESKKERKDPGSKRAAWKKSASAVEGTVSETSFSLKSNDLSDSITMSKSESSGLAERVKPRKATLFKIKDVLKRAKVSSIIEGCDGLCIDTEVWAWGRGQECQIGTGDQLDRHQPSHVKVLSNKHVTKVCAGARHSLALTCASQVFCWGENCMGQLGQLDKSVMCPTRMNFVSNALIWDISAGYGESLLTGYFMSYQPEIYFCGGVDENTKEQVQNPKRVSQLRKTGWVQQITAGSKACACIVDRNTNGFIGTLHEYSATERSFFNQLDCILYSVIKPLRCTEHYNSIESSIYGASGNVLFDSLQQLTNLVGLNIVEITRAIDGSIAFLDSLAIKHYQDAVSVFYQYLKAFGDVLALGGFEFMAKSAGSFLDKLEDVFSELLDENKLDKSNKGVTFRRLMQIPLRRVAHYARLLDKISLIFPTDSSEKDLVNQVSGVWDAVKDAAKVELTSAENTRIFWEACPSRFTESLKVQGRRLLRESKNNPIHLHNAGRFAMHWFFLFNDVFVHAQYSSHQVHSLGTVWAEAVLDDNLKNAISLSTPEERLILVAPNGSDKNNWLREINQAIISAIGDQKGLQVWASSNPATPPLTRQSNYTFVRPGNLKYANYTGMWLSGKPHGYGELVWRDGRKYMGKFKHGNQHGHGTFASPKKDGMEIYDGNWKDGKMHGRGSMRYTNGDIYEGYFKENVRSGHGVLRQGSLGGSDASMYIGEWANDKRNGYGVQDDIIRGEKYMGMWQDDLRSGAGVVVTIDGMYYEGNFIQNKLTGNGLMLTEDNSCYEGEFSAGTQLFGRGVLTFASGDQIHGQFQGTWTEGVKINGTFKKNTVPAVDRKGFNHALGIIPSCFGHLAVHPDRKWNDIIRQCQNVLGYAEDEPVNTDKAWENVAVVVSAGKKTLTAAEKRDGSRTRSNSFSLDALETIPPHGQTALTVEDFEEIKLYLSKAFATSFHPLGKLMESLVDVYRATYVGYGSHPRLLYHAVEEAKSYIRRIYLIIRVLFPALPENDLPIQLYPRGKEPAEIPEGQVHMVEAEEDDGSMVITATGILHGYLLPKIYPPLFTLYALYNEKDDDRYWERIQRLNKQADIALMSYLGIDSKFWQVEDEILNVGTHKLSSIRDHAYRTAVDLLQQLSTAFCPAEKLETIRKTFNELNLLASTSLGEGYLWCMDDLFPVFQYVVIRSRIRHLGAEIHLIDDLMERHLELGELGIMFTTLKASYFQIQNEKILL